MRKLNHRLGLSLVAVALSLPGWSADNPAQAIPNFHQVNDHVFRGGQPASEAWPALAKMGVKVVIDLRREDEHSTAAEGQAVKATGMNYINIPMRGVVAPSNEQIGKILALLNSPDGVFVHCKRGSDRTGAIIACYRIEHDHWSPKQALNEAKSLGMAWTQLGLKRYVMAFQPVANRAALEVSAEEKSQ